MLNADQRVNLGAALMRRNTQKPITRRDAYEMLRNNQLQQILPSFILRSGMRLFLALRTHGIPMRIIYYFCTDSSVKTCWPDYSICVVRTGHN